MFRISGLRVWGFDLGLGHTVLLGVKRDWPYYSGIAHLFANIVAFSCPTIDLILVVLAGLFHPVPDYLKTEMKAHIRNFRDLKPRSLELNPKLYPNH